MFPCFESRSWSQPSWVLYLVQTLSHCGLDHFEVLSMNENQCTPRLARSGCVSLSSHTMQQNKMYQPQRNITIYMV